MSIGRFDALVNFYLFCFRTIIMVNKNKGEQVNKIDNNIGFICINSLIRLLLYSLHMQISRSKESKGSMKPTGCIFKRQ